MSFSNSQAYTTTVPSKDGQAPATSVSTTAANPIPQAPTAQTTGLKQPNTINQTPSGPQARVNNMGHRVGEGVRKVTTPRLEAPILLCIFQRSLEHCSWRRRGTPRQRQFCS
ncbi:hypothetical protein FRC02_000576 [Tulasnella sp. 418]|nr:hypothetical protein FRC02_000576 [Tulasnella sp. 418]